MRFLHYLFVLCASVMLPVPAYAKGDGEGEGRRTEWNVVAHTPWLALRIEQGGHEARLISGKNRIIDVEIERGPFSIVLPVRGPNDAYRLTAWHDASIFSAVDPETRARAWIEDPGVPFYFGPATGMADTAAGSGTLMLNTEGHHYLSGLRLGPDYYRHEVQFNSLLDVQAGDGVELSLTQADGPIYMVIWFDENGDGAMNHSEYEFIALYIK